MKIYRTIILPIILNGCENCSLTVREKHRLKVFKNWLLRRIFGPKRKEVAGGWRRLHSDKFHNLCTSPDIVRVIKVRWMRWVGNVACLGEMRNAHKFLDIKPRGKRLHGRPRCR
jgi:hypothetical protein